MFTFILVIFASISAQADQVTVLTIPVTTSVEFEDLAGYGEGLYVRHHTTNMGGRSGFEVVSEMSEQAVAVPCSNAIIRDIRSRQSLRQLHTEHYSAIRSLNNDLEFYEERHNTCFRDAIQKHEGVSNQGALATSECYIENEFLNSKRKELEDLQLSFETERENLIDQRVEVSDDLSLCRARVERSTTVDEGPFSGFSLE